MSHFQECFHNKLSSFAPIKDKEQSEKVFGRPFCKYLSVQVGQRLV